MARTEPRAAVAVEAGPLIHLHELDALDLLQDFARVFVPETVWDELADRRPAVLRRQAMRLQRVALQEAPDPALWVLVRALALNGGFPQAVQLARQHAPACLLADDCAARLAAEAFSLTVHGTVGVLMRAVRCRRRSPQSVLNLLEALPGRCSLRMSRDLLASLIEQFKIEHDLD